MLPFPAWRTINYAHQELHRRPHKSMLRRQKTALIACNRCTLAKRKCDGDFASGTVCSSCRRSDSVCVYNEKRHPHYVKLLEQRIEYLEGQLSDVVKKPGDSTPESAGPIAMLDLRLFQRRFSSGPTTTFDTIIQGHIIYGLLPESESEFLTDSGSLQNELFTELERILRDNEACDTYFNSYFSGIQLRYPFLVKSEILVLHNSRLELFLEPTEGTSLKKLDGGMVRFCLLMVYAIGSLDDGNHTHRVLYQSATLLKLSKNFQSNSLETIHSMLLLVVYFLRFISAVATWHMMGSVIRLCVAMGLHEVNLTILKKDPKLYVNMCSTFWSAYCLERLISSVTGKPVCLGDRDIKIDYPLDLDMENLESTDAETIVKEFYRTHPHRSLEKVEAGLSKPFQRRTSLTFAIMYTKFRRLESRIRTEVYRPLDRAMRSIVEENIRCIGNWKETLPSFFTTLERDFWMYMYNKLSRLLIQPFLKELDKNDPLFDHCMQSCTAVCNLSDKFHSNTGKITYISLQAVYMSGIDLIFGILSGKWEPSAESFQALNNCETFLVKLAENVKGCEQVLQVFRRLLGLLNRKQQGFSVLAERLRILDRIPELISKTIPPNLKSVDFLFGQESELHFDHEDLHGFQDLINFEIFQEYGDLNTFPTDWGFNL